MKTKAVSEAVEYMSLNKALQYCGVSKCAWHYSNAHKFLYSQFLGILVPWPSHLCVNHRLLHSERYLYTFNVFFSRKFVN